MLLLCTTLTGCGVSETKRLESQTVDVYGANRLEEKETPEPLNQELRSKPNTNDAHFFLNHNDCINDDSRFIQCYEKTRLRLLQTAKQLDEAEVRIYMLKRFIGTPHAR